MEMIRPRRCSRMRRVACRVQLKVPFRWTAMTASHSSSVMLKIMRSRRMPALFTRMSIAPNSLTAVSTMRSAAGKSATLSALATALPPRARIASTTSSATRREAPRPSTSAPRSFTTTAAPSAASSSAIARPMPRPAPVTTAALPSSRPISGLLRRRGVHEPLEHRRGRQAIELVERPVAVRLVERLHGARLRDEGYRAPEAEEELAVHPARVLAREEDDHGCHVVGVELLDLGDAAVLALDAALLPHLARAADLLVDRHPGPRDGTDRVHRDAVLAEVAGSDLGEAADRGLGGAVVRLAGIPEQPRSRAERDDAAPALLAHVSARVADAGERALQVHGEDGIPLLLAHVEDHAVAQDAGTGDEDVDAAEPGPRRADDTPGALPVGHRIGARDGFPTVPLDLGDDVEGRPAGRRPAVDGDPVVVDDDLRAGGRERARHAAADAAPAAGHHRDAA